MVPKEILSPQVAISKIYPGDVIMVGGFMGCGSPPLLLKELSRYPFSDLTVICNDCGWYNPQDNIISGIAVNILKKQFKKVVASHIGLNQEIQQQMFRGETIVDLIPQGTLAERIRCGGSGLGGILTPTGVGTEVAAGKTVLSIDDKDYLLELPLNGDVALIKAAIADKAGNLIYNQSARNFNPLIAMACTTVIAEVDEIVEIGEIDPERIITPSIFVDFLVRGHETEVNRR